MSRLLRLALVVSLLPLAAQAQSLRADAARDHARTAAAANGLASAEFIVTDAVVSARSGTEHVYLRQSIGGLEVVGTEATVGVGRQGVVHAAGLERRVSPSTSLSATPALTAGDAANAVARHNRLRGGAFSVLERTGGASQAVVLSDGGVAGEPVTARLVWHADEMKGVRLAWEVSLYQADAEHWWLAYVDARTGRVLAQTDLVVHDTFGDEPFLARQRSAPALSPFVAARTAAPLAATASQVAGYRVYDWTIEAPIYAPTAPPADGRSLISDPSDATASPQGWHSTGGTSYTVTRGNNVHAYTDIDANNVPDPGSSPDGGSGLVFDFPIDLSAAPSTYRDAGVAQLFYTNNIVHDLLYQYGFDEASGNFQVNNFGRGGAGNDDVRAESQDGSGTNNANFATPSDGSRPRMQMYIGTYSDPDVDGSFDTGVVIHEYGHGISNRLTGGPSQSGCLGNGEQMGEGWSDYYAMMMSMDASDAGADARGMGNYLFDYGVNGGGIRLAPYSTDFGVNGYTYGDTKGMSAVHQVGFVWATIVWEMTWDLINAHGFSADLYNASGSAGNQIAFQLVTEGMKLQPCQPGFVSGRDGILAAEQAIYGGTYAATIQAAFARRGLGYSASEGSTRRNRDNKEAFDLWPGGGGGGDITLTADYQTRGRNKNSAILSWSPADGGSVEVLRNGAVVATTADDGDYIDASGSPGDAYQVCETDSGDCSNTTTSFAFASASASASSAAIDTELRIAPNPVAASARMTFGLEEASAVQLEVFNALGQRVAVLATGTFGEGNHEVRLDATTLPSGIYLTRLTTGAEVQTGRLVVTR